MGLPEACALPDRFWREAAEFLLARGAANELMLAPVGFLTVFPGTIALRQRNRLTSKNGCQAVREPGFTRCPAARLR